MKLTVFEYYNDFYKTVLTEEEYQKKTIAGLSFFVDSARDGVVAPGILAGTKRLGEERSTANVVAVHSEGVLMDEYRSRKLLDYYLDPIAIKNELSLDDIRVLLCVMQVPQIANHRELSDFTDISIQKLPLILQKLDKKGLVKIKSEKNKSKL